MDRDSTASLSKYAQLNRPLVAVVGAYGLGLLLAHFFHLPLAVLVGNTGFLLVLVVAVAMFNAACHAKPGAHGVTRPTNARLWRPAVLIWPLLVLLGWTNFAWRTAVLSPNDVRVLLGEQAALVTVRGTMAETPRLRIVERDEQEQWRSVVRVKVQEIRRENEFLPSEGEVLVNTPGVLGSDFFSGQPVEIAGVIARPPLPLAEGLFDYREYLATRGIYYQLKADATNDWKLREPRLARPPLTDRFLDWSKGTLALGLPVEDEPLRLLWAMTLGWRTAFTGDIDEPFLRAGTMHMFAIDGLRIALLSGMIVTLLRVLRLSRAWCGLVAVPAIWFYTAATGWEASAVRASVMMTIVLGGWALKRPPDLLNSLAAAALVILLLDPRQLGEAGFQLSFFVMLIIALMLPPVNGVSDRVIDRYLKPDPLLPDELVPGWRKLTVIWTRRFAHFCGLSFVAWMGSLPLAAKYFHLFSPVSTLANLPAVPLGALALTANLGALICGHWLGWLTMLFNNAAWSLMWAMTWVSVESAKLPGAYLYVPEPSVATIVIYYAVLVAAFSGWFKTVRRRLGGVTILVLIGAGYFWQWQSSRDATELTVLPLNGGHAVYVDADGRRNDWLINCGNENAVEFTLKNYLRGQGVNSLPRLVLADADARNCGGTTNLDGLFGIGELWTSGVKFRSASYREAVASFEKNGRRKTMDFGGTNGCWQVLYPVASGTVPKADDAALVLRGTFHGTRVLLLADLSRAGQSGLLAQTNDLRADLVIAGLPEADGGEPVCDALLAAVQPKVIVIADSEMPASRRAGRALKERLERAKVPVLYTRSTGAVKIVVDRAGWRARGLNGGAVCSER